jgi:hypothetical protein
MLYPFISSNYFVLFPVPFAYANLDRLGSGYYFLFSSEFCLPKIRDDNYGQ